MERSAGDSFAQANLAIASKGKKRNQLASLAK